MHGGGVYLLSGSCGTAQIMELYMDIERRNKVTFRVQSDKVSCMPAPGTASSCVSVFRNLLGVCGIVLYMNA